VYGALDISTSGMVAQRTRMATIAANIANAGTLLDAEGNHDPFRRRVAHFAPGNPDAARPQGRALGVHVAEIEAKQDAVRLDYRPSSPYANEDGYVRVPDINTATEQINAVMASRAYEANVTAAETTKSMMNQALRMLAERRPNETDHTGPGAGREHDPRTQRGSPARAPRRRIVGWQTRWG